MKISSIQISIGLLCTASHAFAQSEPSILYTVRAGDTLSEIAQHYFDSRLYGPRGIISKILISNPYIQHPDKIYPDDQVLLIFKKDAPENLPLPPPTYYRKSTSSFFRILSSQPLSHSN